MVAFFASATSSGASIVAPAGILAGDLLVLQDLKLNVVGTPSLGLPSGFTLIEDEIENVVLNQTISFKLAVGEEAGATLTGVAGTLSTRKVLTVFRHPTGIASCTPFDVDGDGSSSSLSSQDIDAAGRPAPLIVLGFYGSTGTITSRPFTPAKDGEVGVDLAYTAYKCYNTSPADVNVDLDDFGVNILHSCALELVVNALALSPPTIPLALSPLTALVNHNIQVESAQYPLAVGALSAAAVRSLALDSSASTLTLSNLQAIKKIRPDLESIRVPVTLPEMHFTRKRYRWIPEISSSKIWAPHNQHAPSWTPQAAAAAPWNEEEEGV